MLKNLRPADQSDQKFLDSIQRRAFRYFLNHVNPRSGLAADASRANSPASIAATGMALSTYPIAVERGFLQRAEALKRALQTLRFFQKSDQSGARDASGFRGFYFHFLDQNSGKRAWKSELSSIDSALLLMGALTVAAYFCADSRDERELREVANELCERVDWKWMCNGQITVGHGWTPERGFLAAHWTGYNEALLLYVLALGQASNPLTGASYRAWTAPFQWKTIYGHELVYAGPLFIHQLAHCWLDLRGLPDDFMRARNSDYFQNSQRATLIQREYARRNPRGWTDYHENSWGISASDGPGPETLQISEKTRRFYDYRARGVPFGPDDGTLCPWVVAASLPFCPEIVLAALHHFEGLQLETASYNFEATFNPSFPAPNKGGWVSPTQLGLNQGPILLMIENFRSEFLWDLLRENPVVQRGLTRAGFGKK